MIPEDSGITVHRSVESASASQRNPAMSRAAEQLEEAAKARKCWACGCLHDCTVAIEKAFTNDEISDELRLAIRKARDRLTQRRYDCLGCEVCYPAIAMNVLNAESGERLVGLDPCRAGQVEERDGWPPLPGDYVVLRYRAPVAVCTLTNDTLRDALAREAGPEIGIVGALQTENLGIERLITNVLANPNIRFLTVCGDDSRQAMGHLPGQSLIALAKGGLDERGRIVGARGKRPFLSNLSREAIEHFLRTVETLNMIGNSDVQLILRSARSFADRNPGPADAFALDRLITPVEGYIPKTTALDAAGYFVIYVDRTRGLLSMEHHRNDGVLDAVIEGRTAAAVYYPAIDRGLLSRLDHAAYLGRELARAEHALKSGEDYVQDQAPELPPDVPSNRCGCGTECHD